MKKGDLVRVNDPSANGMPYSRAMFKMIGTQEIIEEVDPTDETISLNGHWFAFVDVSPASEIITTNYTTLSHLFDMLHQGALSPMEAMERVLGK